MKPEVSLIIPTYNEERGLFELIEKAQIYCNEVIVVDGQSGDETVREARRAGARVVLDNGLGKGEAIRVGIKSARYPIIVFMDADWSHNPADIPKMVQLISNGSCDMVIGSRITGGSAEFHGNFDRFIRRFGSQIITWGINLRFGTKLTDSQNGFRALKKSVAEKLNLKENITTIEQEMVIKAFARGYRVGEIPSFEAERKYGESKIKMLRVFYRYLYSWLRYLSFPG